MNQNKGAALIVVLWLSIVLVTIVLSVAYGVRLRLYGARNSVRDMQAVGITLSAVQTVKMDIRAGNPISSGRQLTFPSGICTMTPLSPGNETDAGNVATHQPVAIRFTAQTASYAKSTDVVFLKTESGIKILLWREL